MKNQLVQIADCSMTGLFPLRKQTSSGSKFSDLERLLQGSSHKKYNKENTGDRFIPSRISSNVYNLLTDCINNNNTAKTPVKSNRQEQQQDSPDLRSLVVSA